jgi:UDP-N-acetylglucosamine kinase
MTEEQYQIAYQQIKNDITKNKTRVDSPVAIVLGGQPGAGKSNIYQIARRRFSNNLIELDCDAFRIYHPYYEQIKLIFGKEDGAKTNPFVFRVVDTLVDELSDEKYNLIIESSLNRSKTAINNGKILPPKGYEVELHVMATNKEVSWQGTINRYYEEMRRTGKPRAVPKDFHDQVVSNICNSLSEVKQSGLMSNILIFDRTQTCLYNMKANPDIEPSTLLDQVINGKLHNIAKEVDRLIESRNFFESKIGRVF